MKLLLLMLLAGEAALAQQAEQLGFPDLNQPSHRDTDPQLRAEHPLETEHSLETEHPLEAEHPLATEHPLAMDERPALLPLPPPLVPLPVEPTQTEPPRLIQVVHGAASWYGPGFYGRSTASGERLQKGSLTAAHRTLPFNTLVRVTNLANNRSVVVRINDRGPFKHHRVIDLAHGAAHELQMMQAGEVPVKLEILE